MKKEHSLNTTISRDQLLNSLDVGIWEWNVQTGDLVFNENWAAILGYSLQELEPVYYDTWIRLVHPEDNEKIRLLREAHFRGETEYFESEARMRHRDGSWIWILDRGRVVTRDETGKPVWVVGSHTDITELKKIESALNQNRKLMDYVIGHARSSIAVHDRDMKYIYVSQRYLDEYKVTESNIISRNHYDVFPDLPQKWRDVHRRVLNGEVISGDEDPYIRENGKVEWTRWECRPWYEDSGEIGGLIVYAEVITDRVGLEHQLKESERDLKRATGMTKVGFWRMNLETEVITASEEAQRILGLSGNETSRQLLFSQLLEESRIIIQGKMEGLKNGGKPFSANFRIRRLNDGEIRNVHSVVEFDRDTDTVVSTIQDVTDSVKITEELRQSEEKFRKLFTDHKAVKMILEPETGRILDANRAAEDFYGWSIDILKTMCLEDITSFSSRRLGTILSSSASDRTGVLEFVHSRSDSSTVNVEIFSSFIEAEDKSFIEIIIHDVTEKRVLESQLMHSQKMESIGTLAGGVAHDFNNYIQGILGVSEVLLADLPESHRHYNLVRELLKGSEKASALTRQLLAFARKQTISPVTLDLNTTVAGMLKMLGRIIGENIRLEWKPAADLGTVLLDPSQVDQILVNLCVNARDAIADRGKILIETCNAVFDEEYCSQNAEFKPGEYVMLAVADTGCGMDEGMLNYIFEPFYTTKHKDKGTGLGLSTVYGIIKQNSGFINVYSEPGEGSVFKVYFPRQNGSMDTGNLAGEAVYTGGNNEMILVVEDDPSILNVLGTMIRDLGYRVTLVNNSTEALYKAKELPEPPDLLLTDVVMPDINGRELSANLKKVFPNLRVLFMSGYTANIIAHRGVLDSGVNFIAKPFTKSALAIKIIEALK